MGVEPVARVSRRRGRATFQPLYWPQFFRLLLLLLVALAALVLFMRLARKRIVRGGRETALESQVRRCVCGYALVGLDLPRCPECGRAIGFDKTFEELGVDASEIRRKPRPQTE